MSKHKIDILHVYSGTAGVAGSYMNAIYKALDLNFKQDCIVSYYYLFGYGRKIFYRFSELSNSSWFKFRGKFRLYVRFLELIFGCLYIYLYSLRKKPRIINYSQITYTKIELWLLQLLKKRKIIIAITCHDIKPFAVYTTADKAIKKKQRFYSMANYLIVHNENSVTDMKEYFSVADKKIKVIPFPIMALNNIEINSNTNPFFNQSKKKYAMVGHLREQKGTDILINAWQQFSRDKNDVELIIAGNLPQNIDLEISNSESLKIIDRFLSDAEYIQLIKECNFIVLPYKMGTNSGIPSSVLSLDTLAITSDIEMFRNMDYLKKEFMFKNEDPKSLVQVLEFTYQMTEKKYATMLDVSKNTLDSQIAHFDEQVIKTISDI